MYYIITLLLNPIKGVILNGTLIKFEKSVKTLGIVLDDKLNWKEHVTAISKMSNSPTKLLQEVDYLCPSKTFNRVTSLPFG